MNVFTFCFMLWTLFRITEQSSMCPSVCSEMKQVVFLCFNSDLISPTWDIQNSQKKVITNSYYAGFQYINSKIHVMKNEQKKYFWFFLSKTNKKCGISSRNFLQLAWWIAYVKTNQNQQNNLALILLSSFECNHVMKFFHKSKFSTLFVYRPRLIRFHSNLLYDEGLQVTTRTKLSTISTMKWKSECLMVQCILKMRMNKVHIVNISHCININERHKIECYQSQLIDNTKYIKKIKKTFSLLEVI